MKKHFNTAMPYIALYLLGCLTIITMNSFDKVIMVNIWPSVLTAHGVM